MVSRRTVLGHAAAALAGAAAGGSAGYEAGGTRAGDAAALASSVSPLAVRGSARVTWSAQVADRRAALTFDDGPTEQLTRQVLDVLARHRVTATFFMIGALAERHPDLVKAVRDGGHEIANHSYDHVSAARAGRDAVHAAMTRGADVLERLTGDRPRWYRPPRGELTSATLLAAHATGHELALWSVVRDDGDLADGDAAGVARHLLAALHPGAVVDLHDGIGRSAFTGRPDRSLLTRRHAELAALPGVLDGWLAAGYRFERLSDLVPPASAT